MGYHAHLLKREPASEIVGIDIGYEADEPFISCETDLQVPSATGGDLELTCWIGCLPCAVVAKSYRDWMLH